LAAPVKENPIERLLRKHQLQGLAGLDHKQTAHHRVAVGHPLPGLAVGIHRQGTAQAATDLLGVTQGFRLIQAVKNHALLHRRQRIYILKTAEKFTPPVQLPLFQSGKGKVGRGHAGFRYEANLDQLHQLCQVGFREGHYRLGRVQSRVIAPVDAQASVGNHGVDVQLVETMVLRAHRAAGGIFVETKPS